jgi:putative endopeptidase
MISSVPVNEWKTYLRWRLVHDMASALPHAFVNESFDFYGRTLGGTSEMQPRWKRMARATDAALGEAVGQLYVDKTFPPEAKEKALDMVNNLQAAFRQHIAQLDWMTEDTKQKALEKLNSFAVKIGYPDEWKDYSALTVDRGPYVQNYMRANEFEFNRNMSKLGQPVDRNEWFMSPPTVNAYYNPSMNEIVFPAGILQPPFFDPNADDAVNYGGMGAVIGHELTHGFDDQGRQYDAYGNLTDWWTAEDAKKFEQRAQVVQRQFDNYTVLDSIPVNGKLTLGENIADLGGLAIAHTALQKALENNNPGKIDGLTPDQRFFLAWAQIWRTNARDEFLRQQVVVDPHAPAKHRVNGPVKNLPAFREAFGCGVSAPMVRADTAQAQIW